MRKRLILIACLCFLPLLSWAGWPGDPTVNLRVTEHQHVESFAAAPDGANGMIVVWLYYNQVSDPNNNILFARRVRVDGTLGDVVQLTSTSIGTHIFFVAPDGYGNAIVVWIKYFVTGGKYYHEVWAQKISPDGVEQWETMVHRSVSTNSYYSVDYPVAVGDGAGGAIIAWCEGIRSGGGLSEYDVYAAHVNPDGTLDWSKQITSDPDNQYWWVVPSGIHVAYHRYSNIASDHQGGAYLAWWDDGQSDIVVCRINSQGEVVWSQTAGARFVSGFEDIRPSMVSAPDGGILIYRGGRGLGVKKFRKDDGSLLFTKAISPSPAGYDNTNNYVVAIPDGSGGTYIAFGALYYNSYTRTFVQRVYSNGVVWSQMVLVSDLPYSQSTQFISRTDGGVVVAWADYREGHFQGDIYALKITSDGVPIWASNGVQVCGAPSNQRYPWLVSDGAGGAIIAWLDARGSTDVYAQRVFSDSSLPVELSAFTARVENGRVILKWRTESEPFGFHIHRIDEKGRSVRITRRAIVPSNPSQKEFTYIDTPPHGGIGRYRVEVIDLDGSRKLYPPITVELKAGLKPARTELLQNFPNPFNPDTWIPFTLSEPGEVVIRIFSSDGKLIRTLNLGKLGPGDYTSKDKAAYWDGRDEIGQPAASGIYFYSLQAPGFSAVRKMVLSK